MYMCARGIDYASFYDCSFEFWKRLNNVIFFVVLYLLILIYHFR